MCTFNVYASVIRPSNVLLLSSSSCSPFDTQNDFFIIRSFFHFFSRKFRCTQNTLFGNRLFITLLLSFSFVFPFLALSQTMIFVTKSICTNVDSGFLFFSAVFFPFFLSWKWTKPSYVHVNTYYNVFDGREQARERERNAKWNVISKI